MGWGPFGAGAGGFGASNSLAVVTLSVGVYVQTA